MTEAIGAAKKALRQRALDLRRNLSSAQRTRYSAAIRERLQGEAVFLTARHVFAYVSMEDEVHTEAILRGLIERGQAVSIPYIVGKRRMEAAELSRMEDLEEGAYGIRTIKPAVRHRVDPETIDLILVPGVAFSPTGQRLGMGGGFYDAFLPRAAKAIRLALAYSCQIFPILPTVEHDVGVHRVLTEEGFLPI
ncbi:MAG: 5-formyltetrahydrofolate cyclo-ligase [Schwartzia sp. (in: firmicutes)]